MSNLISEAEKMLKKSIKKGEIKVLDDIEYNEIFDKIEEEMQNYRIDENYKRGTSRIEAEKVIIYQNYN